MSTALNWYQYVNSAFSSFLQTNGNNVMTGNLNFNTNKGINLIDPTNLQDAATKNYVDTSRRQFSWNTTGNSGLISGYLGTVDNNNFTIINNNNSIATIGSTINSGYPGINITTGNFFTVGNQNGLPDTSAICIKQGAQLSNVSTGSYWGLKFFNNSTNDGAYMGIADVGGHPGFAIFIEQALGIYTRCIDIVTSLVTIYNNLSMNNNNITNVTNPTNPQDAATKNYVDNQIINKFGVLIGELINQTSFSGIHTITFTIPANTTSVRVNILTYITNFTSFQGGDYMLGPLNGSYTSIYNYANTTNTAGNPATTTCIGMTVTGFTSSTISFTMTGFGTPAPTGWSVYIYN